MHYFRHELIHSLRHTGFDKSMHMQRSNYVPCIECIHKSVDKCTNLYGLAICTNLPWGLNGDHTVSWASEMTRVSTSSILAGPGKLAKKGLVVTAFINVFTYKTGSQSANCTQKKDK